MVDMAIPIDIWHKFEFISNFLKTVKMSLGTFLH
jgi:hypothetical protein